MDIENQVIARPESTTPMQKKKKKVTGDGSPKKKKHLSVNTPGAVPMKGKPSSSKKNSHSMTTTSNQILVEEQPQVTEPEAPMIPGAVATKDSPKSKKMKCHMSTSKKSLQPIEPTEVTEPDPLEIPGATSVKDAPKDKKLKKQLHGESKYTKKPSSHTQSSSGPQAGALRHDDRDNQDDCRRSSTSDNEIVADVAENPVTATVVDENDLERQIISKYLKPPPVLVPGVRMNSKSFDKDEDGIKKKRKCRIVMLILGIVAVLVLVGIVVGVVLAAQSNEPELPSPVNGTSELNQIISPGNIPIDPTQPPSNNINSLVPTQGPNPTTSPIVTMPPTLSPTSKPTVATPAPITPSPTAQPTLSPTPAQTATPVITTSQSTPSPTAPGSDVTTTEPGLIIMDPVDNPTNFLCEEPRFILDPQGGSVIITGNTVNATEPAKCGETTSNVAWYSIIGTGHLFKISTCSETTDFPTQVTKTIGCSGYDFDGCFSTLIDTGCTANTYGAAFSFMTEWNQKYELSVGGRAAGDMGNFKLNVTEYKLPKNAYCASPTAIPDPQGGSVTVSGSTKNAFGDPPACGKESDAVWYNVVGNGKTFTISTCSPNTDFPTQVGKTSYCSSYDWDGCYSSQIDPACTVNTNGASITWETVVGQIYEISVSGREDTVQGNFELILSES
jgi:hypothetical protein